MLLGVEQGYLYWRSGKIGEAGVIGREQRDGSDFDPHFLTGVAAADGALTSQWLYYTGSVCDPGCIDVDGSVSRVALEPGATPQPLASLGPGVGEAIAVDSLGDPFPAVSDHQAPRWDRHRAALNLRGREALGSREADRSHESAAAPGQGRRRGHPASPWRQTRAPPSWCGSGHRAARLPGEQGHASVLEARRDAPSRETVRTLSRTVLLGYA